MRLHDISHLFRDILPWPPGLTRYEQISPESHVDRGPDSHVQQGKRRLQCPWAHSFSGVKFKKQTWRFPWTWHCSVVCDCSGNSWIESAYASFFPSSPKSPTMPLADIADLSEPKPQHTFALDSNQFQHSCHEEKKCFMKTNFKHIWLYIYYSLFTCWVASPTNRWESQWRSQWRPLCFLNFLLSYPLVPS